MGNTNYGRFFTWLITLTMLVVCHSVALAQNTCSQTLVRAQIAYYEGRASEVVSILDQCLTSGFSREEKIQAYYLLTLTHLYLNESKSAEQTLLLFLRMNPEYQIKDGVDPMEFINLYKQFRTWPVYLIGGKIGGNFSFVRPLRYYSTDNLLTYTPVYMSMLQYQLGISLELPINSRFSFVPELHVAGKSYEYHTWLFNYVDLSFIEKQTWLHIPLVVTYQLKKGRWSPFVSSGLDVGQLWGARAQVRRSDISAVSQAGEPNNDLRREVTGPDISLNPQRRLFNLSGVLGAGFKYKKGRNTVMLDVRYNVGMLNMVTTKNRYANPELLYRYGYLDNDFRMNSLSFSLGYMIPVYKPKLLQRKEVREKAAE